MFASESSGIKNVKNADWYASNVVAKFVPTPGLADTEFAVGNVMLLSVVVRVNSAGPPLPVAPVAPAAPGGPCAPLGPGGPSLQVGGRQHSRPFRLKYSTYPEDIYIYLLDFYFS